MPCVFVVTIPAHCSFFFQAEDGIRDLYVTGVQTCALPIFAGHLMAAERWGEAAGAARAAVRGEPLRETSRAALIRIFLAEGNVSEAVREFRSYQALLHDELGLEPTPRLCRLIQDA